MCGGGAQGGGAQGGGHSHTALDKGRSQPRAVSLTSDWNWPSAWRFAVESRSR